MKNAFLFNCDRKIPYLIKVQCNLFGLRKPLEKISEAKNVVLFRVDKKFSQLSYYFPRFLQKFRNLKLDAKCSMFYHLLTRLKQQVAKLM